MDLFPNFNFSSLHDKLPLDDIHKSVLRFTHLIPKWAFPRVCTAFVKKVP